MQNTSSFGEDEVAGGAGPNGHDQVEQTPDAITKWFSLLRRPWVTLLVVLVVVVAVGAVVTTRRTAQQPISRPPTSRQPVTTSTSRSLLAAPPRPGSALAVGAGSAVDLLMTDSLLWVLYAHPSRLVRVAAQSGTPAGQVRTAGGAFRVVYDGAEVWVVAVQGGATVARAYDQISLHVTTEIRLPFVSTAAVFVSGRLWLGGPDGLYARGHGAAAAVRVGDVRASVTALAADPAHDQLLEATSTKDGSTQLSAVSTLTTRVTRTATIHLSKPSIAVTAQGTWIAGDGGPKHVLRLDQKTLLPTAGGPADVQVGAGAQVWAGQSVVWVTPINDRGGLACFSPNSGQILGRWPTVDGLVVSAAATAYVLDRHAMVVALPITRTCFPG